MNTDFILLNPLFSEVPKDQIQWMLDKGEILKVPEGEYLFSNGQVVEHLNIIKSGSIRIYFSQKGQQRILGELTPGDISGVLPYSRMKGTTAFGQAQSDTEVFLLHKDHFPEMVRENYDLSAAFVHHMTNRVRSFTSDQLQNEKLMALGKLSAGLAHELNNPASAIVRSAQALQSHLKLLPDNFKRVIKINITEAQVDAVNEVLFSKIDQVNEVELSLMEKTDREDALADWLEDRGVEDGYAMAENMVEFGFEESDLDFVAEHVKGDDLVPVLGWMENNLITDKMVGEIEEAANRIAELVSSVKGYTHMDRSQDAQKVNVHDGLVSTVTMLKHKIKQNQIEVVKDFDPDLQNVKGIPGELNQVFTNLIDNALDAMEDNGGTLTLKTYNDREFVRINVQDSGSGISEEHIRKIFDPFFTTKEMGKGTGMGLDVVGKIVTKHRGDIKVKSQPGETVFELCFPAFS